MKTVVGVVLLAFLGSAAASALDGLVEEQLKENDGRLFVKSAATTTWTFLSSFTSTVPYTCFTTQGTPQACTGRRLKRARKMKFDQQDEVDLDALLGGEGSSDGNLDPTEEKEGQNEKLFFTVVRTSSTTV